MTHRTFTTLGATVGLLAFGYAAGTAGAEPYRNYTPPTITQVVQSHVTAELTRRSAASGRARPLGTARCRHPGTRNFWAKPWRCTSAIAGIGRQRFTARVYEDGSLKSLRGRQPGPVRITRRAARATAVSWGTFARLQLRAFTYRGVIRPPARRPVCRLRVADRWSCIVEYEGFWQPVSATAYVTPTLRVRRVDS